MFKKDAVKEGSASVASEQEFAEEKVRTADALLRKRTKRKNLTSA